MPSKKDCEDFSIYLEEISKTPLLTPLAEKELYEKIQNGDKEAEHHLIKANLRLVVFVAKKYTDSSNMTLFQLVQEGNSAVVRAAKKFDHSKGKFSTYAGKCIRNAIISALKKENKRIQSIDSLMEIKGKDRESSFISIKDKRAVMPEEKTNLIIAGELLRTSMLELKYIEQEVVSLFFGLKDGIPHNKMEIAEILGKKRDKISQILELGLRKLRRNKKLLSLRIIS